MPFVMGERLTDAEIEAMIGRMLREPRVSEGFKLRTKMTATAAWYRSCGCPDTTKGPRGEKRPADVIGAAVKVMRIATGEIEDERDATASAAAQLGKLGDAARAKALTPERRAEIARKGAAKRWEE